VTDNSAAVDPWRTPGERFDLTGKVALVTGGSRGLGRAMVTAFAAAGADVVVTSRKLDACEAVAGEVRAATGRRALALACNVGRWNELDGLVEGAYEAFGRVDILVNNAGMSLLYGQATDVTEDMWDKVVDLNMKGVFRLSALVGSRMVGGGGSIINVSSVGSIRPNPAILPYAAAKAGMNSLTVGLAHTYGPTVRVNGIMAGPFFTDVTRGWDLEAFAEGAKRFALKRGGQPDEVVGAALYFASEASSFTTGTLLRVDGGIP
jgi:NAD(P)-dependent dehydrogenase (short-subunit alcohol dehydrogenase family)